jgi:hypothetical protein
LDELQGLKQAPGSFEGSGAMRPGGAEELGAYQRARKVFHRLTFEEAQAEVDGQDVARWMEPA